MAVGRGPRGQIDRACHATHAVPSSGIAKWVIGGKWRGNNGGWIDRAHTNEFTFLRNDTPSVKIFDFEYFTGANLGECGQSNI